MSTAIAGTGEAVTYLLWLVRTDFELLQLPVGVGPQAILTVIPVIRGVVISFIVTGHGSALWFELHTG